MKIVFMGTPDFAVPSLKKLIESHHEVTAVVTGEDKPRGRGQTVLPTPVKRAALQADIEVLQPQRLREGSFISRLKELGADCFAVVAFRILPPEVYEIPPKGSFNLHASLLPEYRGAAPIQWALINGEKETGVTTFYLRKKVDTGDIILQKSVTIGEDENAGELHDRLAAAGAGLVLKTADLIERGEAEGRAQEGDPSPAPKLLPRHRRIDWRQPAKNIVNLVRGLSPVPGAVTGWKDGQIKIYRAKEAECPGKDGDPGTVVSVSNERLIIRAGDGCLEILELQLQSRRRMQSGPFLRGADLTCGDHFH